MVLLLSPSSLCDVLMWSLAGIGPFHHWRTGGVVVVVVVVVVGNSNCSTPATAWMIACMPASSHNGLAPSWYYW